jgi:hypothetical protein
MRRACFELYTLFREELKDVDTEKIKTLRVMKIDILIGRFASNEVQIFVDYWGKRLVVLGENSCLNISLCLKDLVNHCLNT